MSETVFSRIIRGELPCHKVYEDEHVIAFLDIAPLSRGHTLLVPKEPAATLDRLSDDSAAALGRALPRLCRAVMQATGATAYNVLQNNGREAHQAIFHVHFHIIPRFSGQSEGAGLGLVWRPVRLDDREAPQLARRIADAVRAQSPPAGNGPH